MKYSTKSITGNFMPPMTQEEINEAVAGVMELRPKVAEKMNPKNAQVTRRLKEREYELELEAIMNDEPLKSSSSYYFDSSDQSKSGRRNDGFNVPFSKRCAK